MPPWVSCPWNKKRKSRVSPVQFKGNNVLVDLSPFRIKNVLVKSSSEEWRVKNEGEPKEWWFFLPILVRFQLKHLVFSEEVCRMQAKVTHPIPGQVGHVLLSGVWGYSILIDFSILGYFCQFIHPLDIAIFRIKWSRILVNTITSTTCRNCKYTTTSLLY